MKIIENPRTFFQKIRKQFCLQKLVFAFWPAMSKDQVADVDREGASNNRCPLAVRTALPKHQCLSYQDDLYQGGPILRAVQLSDILLDGKEFVDRPALNSPNTVHADWRKLCEETKGRELTQEELADFVEKHFGKSGWELEACVVPPTDFEKVPAYLDKLTDAGLILLGQEIQEIWMNLGKRVKPEVLEMEKRTSMLYIPNFFVIPGGRFKVGTFFFIILLQRVRLYLYVIMGMFKIWKVYQKL